MSMKFASKNVTISFTIVLTIVFAILITLTTVDAAFKDQDKGAAGKDQDKVSVCHITGTHDFGEGDVPIGRVIQISESAYQAHIKHGDPVSWEVVTLPDGSEVCLHDESIGSANDTDWGDPKKQSRTPVPDTMKFWFYVVGDMQFNIVHSWDHDDWNVMRSQRIVQDINLCETNGDAVGVVAVGDLTQNSCCQEVVGFRQQWEASYPGHDGGAILGCLGDDTDFCHERYSNGYKINKWLFPGLGNHDDPTEKRETCDSDASCSDRVKKTCHSNFVKKYIRARIEGSHSLYEAPTLLNIEGGNYLRGSGGDIYVWEWGSYHFIHGNIWPGYGHWVLKEPGTMDLSKLTWLRKHLEEAIGDSGKPVLLFQHYGWDGFSFAKDSWWTEDQAAELVNVLCRRENTTDTCDPYNVIGIFSGHTHEFEHKIIDAGYDKDGNPVRFDNYIVTDAGPATNDGPGYFSVKLEDNDNGVQGHMEVWRTYILDDGVHKRGLYKEKDFKLAFVDWEQGRPDNKGGIESCVAVGSKGRFDDFDCSVLRQVACRNRTYNSLYITKSTHNWYDAQEVCKSINADFVAPTNVYEQREFMEKFKETEPEHWVWVNAKSPWVYRTHIERTIGAHNQGAGIAMADINGNGKTDLIEYHIYDPTSTEKNFAHYSVGWDMDAVGKVTGWSVRHNCGNSSSEYTDTQTGGGGITAGDINGNGTPELITYFTGINGSYYRVGWDIKSDGSVDSWRPQSHVHATHDIDQTLGAGITMGDIDGNGIPELIFYDIDGDSYGAYTIAWNIDDTGALPKVDWYHHEIGLTNEHTSGAGIALADIDGNGRPELMTYFIKGLSGVNQTYYNICWNLTTAGVPTSCSENRRLAFGGINGYGGGIAIGDIDRNGRPDLVRAIIDDKGANKFHYGVALNINEEGKLTTLYLDENGVLRNRD